MSDANIVAEIVQEDGARLVVLAERLPRDTHVRMRRADVRRLAALLARAGRRPAAQRDTGEWIVGEPPAELAGRELCSAHFLSGAGWAWRVTAALTRRRDDTPRASVRPRTQSPAFARRPSTTRVRT